MIKRILISLVLVVLFSIVIYSSYNILRWVNDNKATEELIINVYDNVYKEDVSEEDEKIDFRKLIELNNETVGWIEIEDTNINYPIVRHKDNSYYLSHSFDHSLNDAGWVFLDYRNSLNTLDKNSIIYAHGRIDGSMFGSLKFLFNDDYFNKEKHEFNVYTPTRTYTFEVFSFYKIRTTSDYLTNNFDDDEEFLNFTDKLKIRSAYNFNVDISSNDRILTLSTCYNSYEKLVLHARLVR